MDTHTAFGQSKEKRRLSIVIPALNEEEGVGRTIQAIPKEQLQGIGYDVEVIVVDNGSEDQTGELARRAGVRRSSLSPGVATVALSRQAFRMPREILLPLPMPTLPTR